MDKAESTVKVIVSVMNFARARTCGTSAPPPPANARAGVTVGLVQKKRRDWKDPAG
jgi:hypothetical protein